MNEKDIYSVCKGYSFDDYQEGTVIALFLILEELKKINKTMKQRNDNANTTR